MSWACCCRRRWIRWELRVVWKRYVGSLSSYLSRGDLDKRQNPDIVQDFFNFVEKVRSTPFVMDEVIYANAGVLSFRHGVLSPPAAVFRCSRPMRNIRPRLTRALLPRSSIHFPRTFSSHPILLSIHVLSTRIADSTYKRHAGERRLCRREATPARHTRTRYHARAARRLCRRSAKIGRPEPRRALFGSGRQDASRKQTLDTRDLIWGA